MARMNSRLLIAIPRPLRTLLTYEPPQAIGRADLSGYRVTVPLGHGKTVGLVVRHLYTAEPTEENFSLKPIQKVLDDHPLLDAHLLELLQWAARYYHHPVGEVVFAALPVALRDGKPLLLPRYWQAREHADQENLLKRAKRQQGLYDWLLQKKQACEEAEIREFSGAGWQKALQGLLEKNLIEQVEPDSLQTTPAQEKTSPAIQLTPAQQACLQQCRDWVQADKPQPILLHGVTGSGKTEIYLRLIEEQLAAQKQVLVLVPEIGLTPQLVQRFGNHFPQHNIVSLHSGLNDTERLQAWLQARSGQAHIIIGTRSAIFTPCAKLGMIIVDEEHDSSLKQQEGFRYHGRDLAIKRAHMLNIPTLLGSATPALETLHNADQGRYHYIRLDQRPGKSRPPSLAVQDIRGIELKAGLSEQTLQAIRRTLERNEQVMLFINRRGFAPLLLCPACGWQASCPSCSTHMTYHARLSKLICHHCGHERRADSQCPDCQNPGLGTQGHGTERIELLLQQLYPETPVVRIDRDSTSRKGSLQRHLDMIHNTERLLLVGTQMLAKGHDFPNLTLVIILDVDQSLLSPEYHALERFGQLLTQVAGRAGRSHKPGHVILQTTQPQHPVLLTLLQHGYLPFARQLLEERRRWQFPPFGYQALIRADGKDMELALDFLQKLRGNLLENWPEQTDINVLGPVPAPMEKRAGRYRAQLLLQCKRRDVRHLCLSQLTDKEKNVPNSRNVRWSIDVDPVELS